MSLFRPPELGDSDRRVMDVILNKHRELRHQVAAPRRWIGLLRRVAMARAVRGSNTIEGFTVSIPQTIEGGMTVRVTTAPDPRSMVPDLFEERPAAAAKLVRDAGLVPKFMGANPTNAAYVASQSPVAGQLVNKGSTVSMLLRTGPLP